MMLLAYNQDPMYNPKTDADTQTTADTKEKKDDATGLTYIVKKKKGYRT
jgi:hypothetical protein